MKTFKPNIINRYDEMIYNSRPVKFDEFISDKYNKVHVELYNDALNKFFNATINNAIDEKFIFNFFKIIENTYNEDLDIYYENFYNKYMSLENNYVKSIINKISINEDKLLQKMFNITNTFIDAIKQSINDNNIIIENDKYLKNDDIDDFRIIYYDKSIYLKSESPFFNSGDDINDINEHTFISYNYHYDSEFNISEWVEEDLFISEDDADKFVFLLENECGTRIAYNSKGNFYIMLDNTIYDPTNYNKFNFNSYINNINKKLIELFREYALQLYKENHRIIEIKNNEYWMPSSVIIISNIYPYKKTIESLSKYWNTIQGKTEYNISDIKLSDYEINDAELEKIDYIKGIATMRSKLKDIVFEVPFEYLNNSTKVSNEMSLDLI